MCLETWVPVKKSCHWKKGDEGQGTGVASDPCMSLYVSGGGDCSHTGGLRG